MFRPLAVALMLASVSLAAPLQAAPPAQVKTQVPGFYRMMVGGFEVTALYDGYVDLDRTLLKGIQAKDMQSLLARMFLADHAKVQTAVNGYLVHTGDKLVLVDAGAAKCFGPTLGNLAANIKAAGYDPAQVDLVLLTHLHADHACGITADGQMVFPNAEVMTAKGEADFWLSEEVAAKMPEKMQGFFKLSRDSVAPYQAAGKFKTFSGVQTLAPGLTTVPTEGHTPGHAGYLFSNGGASLLLWGDIVHSYAVQFARPEVAIEFDTDQKAAIATRKKVFAQAARDKLWIGGAHLPFPGLGHVRTEGKAYAWVPAEYAPLRSDR